MNAMRPVYRNRYLKAFLCAAILLSSATAALAQKKGFMINISASGVVDPARNLYQMACAMIEDTVPLAIFAEAVTDDTDPALMLLRLLGNDSMKVAENDDYTRLPLEDLNVLKQRLRLPMKVTDAALLGTTSDAVLCAVAFESRADGPPGRINLSINDLAGVATTAPSQEEELEAEPDEAAGDSGDDELSVAGRNSGAPVAIDDALKARVLEAVRQRLGR